MPTIFDNPQATSSKFKSKIEKPIRHCIKSDSLDVTFEDELGLNKPFDQSDEERIDQKYKEYDGFKVKVLPTKEKIILRNEFIYMDPKTFSIVWLNIGLFVVLHALGFYGVYRCYTEQKFYAFAFSYLIGIWGGMGITAGAHRLWSHRSYKARLPLRIFLMIGHTIAGQNNLYVWCRDHRVHHKFSESDGDPHNSRRGFFFAHMGWLLRKKHPDVFIKGATVPIDDLLEDPVIRFNIRYYYLMYFLFAFFMPTWIGAYVFEEGWWFSFLVASAGRYVTSLHSTWFVNSAAHMFGDQPYNIKQQARENPFVSVGAFVEGYHNYHHSFPSDYATSELGSKINFTKKFIDLMAFFGQAYDLKSSPKRVVDASKAKTSLILKSRSKCAY